MADKSDLIEFREARRWSQQRLADELGVNQSTVWRWESGAAVIKPYIFQALDHLAERFPVTTEAAE